MEVKPALIKTYRILNMTSKVTIMLVVFINIYGVVADKIVQSAKVTLYLGLVAIFSMSFIVVVMALGNLYNMDMDEFRTGRKFTPNKSAPVSDILIMALHSPMCGWIMWASLALSIALIISGNVGIFLAFPFLLFCTLLGLRLKTMWSVKN